MGGLPDGGDDPKKKPLTLSNWLARSALADAQRGDPSALIARLRLLPRGEPLRRDEIDFIIALLEAKTWKALKADLLRIEKERIGLRIEFLQIESLRAKERLSQKAAISIVQDERKRPNGRKPSERYMKDAIAAYKASKLRRRKLRRRKPTGG